MTSATETLDKVAAVIVLYLPSENLLLRLLQSLQGTVKQICVIDNTPTQQMTWVDCYWFDSHGFKVQYQALGDNMGIAKAQNVGIEMAIQNGCDHVILFDQDSEASPGMVSTLLAEEHMLLSQGIKVGSVGPAYIDEKTGDYAPAITQGFLFIKRIPIHAGDVKPINVDCLIASGALIRTEVLQNVGFMLDAFFIDWVDIEWSLRAGRAQYSHYMVTKTVMSHSIGDDYVNVGSRKVPMHNDIRKFYIIRNACNLMLNPKIKLARKFDTGYKIFAYTAIYLATSPKKINMCKLLCRAATDGFLGRLGKAAFVM
jgi:rhamnosyltransferase